MPHGFWFLVLAALSCTGTLWVYRGVRRRQAALVAVFLGIALFVGPAIVYIIFSQGFSLQPTTRTIGSMGMGFGILVGGIFSLLFGPLFPVKTNDDR